MYTLSYTHTSKEDYPIYFILNAERKAYKIYNNNANKTKNDNTRRIQLLTNSVTKNFNNTLHTSDIPIIDSTLKTTNDLISKIVNKSKNVTLEAGVSSIRCATWNEPYIGETSRSLKKRIYEHKQALFKNNTSYALVLHRNGKNIILI